MAQKSKLATMLLCWVLGVFGVHRFYLGKIWTGILYLCTGGLWGVGTVFDMVMLLLNVTKDKQGVPLKNDIPTFVIVILFILWFVLAAILGLVTGLFEGIAMLFI